MSQKIRGVKGTRDVLPIDTYVKDEDPWLRVAKGAELAVFEMGSTVVVLFAPGVKLASGLRPGASIRLGEPLEGS